MLLRPDEIRLPVVVLEDGLIVVRDAQSAEQDAQTRRTKFSALRFAAATCFAACSRVHAACIA
jgi:hypothetical protein